MTDRQQTLQSKKIMCMGRYHNVETKHNPYRITLEPIEPCPTISVATFRLRYRKEVQLDDIYACDRCTGVNTTIILLQSAIRFDPEKIAL